MTGPWHPKLKMSPEEERIWKADRVERARVNRLASFRRRMEKRCSVVGDILYVQFSDDVCTLVDACKIETVLAYNWSISIANGKTYFHAHSNGRWVLLHRVLVGAKPKERVDHKDGNTLNNRLYNLRTDCRGINNINAIRPTPRSGFTGVAFDSRASINPYSAKIGCDYKTINLGSFPSLRLAAQAYVNAVEQRCGNESAVVIHLNRELEALP